MPQLGETLALANADRIAKQLYGDDAVASSAHCIFKPARTGAETPWHQDESYWSGAHAYRTGSIWIPLQEASVENGCMWFVPRSHELDVVPHQSINNDPRVHGLELRADQMHLVKDAEPQPLPPGGATIHGSRMLHYAGPNRSDVPRRAYIISIAAPARLRETPRLFPWLEEKRTARMERMGVGRGDAADDVASKPAG